MILVFIILHMKSIDILTYSVFIASQKFGVELSLSLYLIQLTVETDFHLETEEQKLVEHVYKPCAQYLCMCVCFVFWFWFWFVLFCFFNFIFACQR